MDGRRDGVVTEESENWLGEPNVKEGEVRCSKIENRSVLKPSVVVISASLSTDPEGGPAASEMSVTDADRWEAHHAAVWETDGVGSALCGLGIHRTGNVIVPEEYNDAVRRAECIEHERSGRQAQAGWLARGAGGAKRRIEWMLEGDERCRFSRGLTARSYCQLSPSAVHNAWAHREKTDQVVERDDEVDISATSYGHVCPTTLGKGVHYVNNKATADAVQDAIELYILDTSRPLLERSDRVDIIANPDPDALSELELRRTLQRGDRIGHGHFTKWRQAIEESCAKHGREAFWVRSMGGGKSKQKQWNQALRNDQSFPLGDEGKDTIQKVRFADVDRVECYESSDDYRKYSNPDRTEADANGRRKRYLRLEIDRAQDYRRGGGGLATTVKHKQRQARRGEQTFGPEGGFHAAAAEVNQVSSTRTTRPVGCGELAANDQISTIATGGDCEDSQRALENENLLGTVNVEDCIFEMGDCQKIAERYPLKEGAVMIADTGRYAGLVMQMHEDCVGANFWVDKRVNRWSTRRRARQKHINGEINELESSDGVPKVRSGGDGAADTGQKFQTPGEGEESAMPGQNARYPVPSAPSRVHDRRDASRNIEAGDAREASTGDQRAIGCV